MFRMGMGEMQEAAKSSIMPISQANICLTDMEFQFKTDDGN